MFVYIAGIARGVLLLIFFYARARQFSNVLQIESCVKIG